MYRWSVLSAWSGIGVCILVECLLCMEWYWCVYIGGVSSLHVVVLVCVYRWSDFSACGGFGGCIGGVFSLHGVVLVCVYRWSVFSACGGFGVCV